jgi:hypothetical protein
MTYKYTYTITHIASSGEIRECYIMGDSKEHALGIYLRRKYTLRYLSEDSRIAHHFIVNLAGTK